MERAARDGEAAHHGYLVFETAEGGRVVVEFEAGREGGRGVAGDAGGLGPCRGDGVGCGSLCLLLSILDLSLCRFLEASKF